MIARRVVTLAAAASLLVGACTAGTTDAVTEPGCERDIPRGWSVARVWNEVLLDAIRRDVPAPTVHARNLFHVSVAMWDAWAAYDPAADGYLVHEEHRAEDVRAARETAISYAAYRVLLWRYAHATGLQQTFDDLVGTMRRLCYRIDVVGTEGGAPAALGNRIAAAVIAFGQRDGAREDTRYADPTYRPANVPMVVTDPGTTMRDPNRWQPLALSRQVAQNGLPIPGGVQRFIGPHWGHVRSFALVTSSRGLPIDPGPPPFLGDRATDDDFKRAAVDVIRYSAMLDATDGATVDIGPGALGDNTLGADDGDGYERNPVTGEPYEPNRVLRADFARVLAEFWADGPSSETPPGHWNTIANSVSDSPGLVRRIGDGGPEVDRLEWDVKLYLALNGAMHDAAVAAWGAKAVYDSVRPISMIRYMGERGQSSEPDGPSYDPEGLPLVPGLVEVITARSSADGGRHEHLAGHEGQIAIRSWRGNPDDPTTQASGVGWILAAEWLPYQRPTFVTPSFAGYVSGHSTFSRAGAVVMTAFTGSAYFPGGLSEWTVRAGELVHEEGPTADVTLQWASYGDAADQAGVSRLFGGIHIRADDLAGRVMGARCGEGAWALARTYFDGSARA